MAITEAAPLQGDAAGGLGQPRRQRHEPGARTAGTFPPLRGLLPLGVVLALWEALGNHRSPYFPPPSSWSKALVRLWDSGVLVPAAAETLSTVLAGLGAATLVGVVLGLVLGASPRADRALNPTLEFLRAMPPAAMVPIAALLLGYDETMKLVVVTIAATWSVLLNTRAGVRGLDPTLHDVARSLNLTRFDRLRKVTIPALLPSILLGVRVAAPVALVITLLVEIVTQLEGVGALIGNAQRTYQSAQVYGLILVAGLFSLVIAGAVAALQAKLLRHRGH